MTTNLATASSPTADRPHPVPRTMRETFADVVGELLDDDLSVALVLADISVSLFVAAAARHPERVVNVGIREQLAVNVGAGLALSGMRPVVHTFAPFLVERAFEQIKLGFSHQDVGGVLVSAGASYDNATSGRTHQAPADVALLATLPGWTIHVPGHPHELDELLRHAVADSGRHYLRTSTASNAQPLPTGRLHTVRSGSRGTVLAVGTMLDPVLAATEGMDLAVAYTATVRPFDRAGFASLVTGDAVVLVEPYLEGTSAAEVSAALAATPHRLLSIGVPPRELRHYGAPEDHARAHGLDPAGLHGRVAAFLG